MVQLSLQVSRVRGSVSLPRFVERRNKFFFLQQDSLGLGLVLGVLLAGQVELLLGGQPLRVQVPDLELLALEVLDQGLVVATK